MKYHMGPRGWIAYFCFLCIVSINQLIGSNLNQFNLVEPSLTCQAKINAANDETCANDEANPFILLETSTAALGGFEIIQWDYLFEETVYVTLNGVKDTITNGTFVVNEDHNSIQVIFPTSGPKKITLRITSTDSPGNGGECIDETSILVTAKQEPGVSIESNNANVCVGDSTDVTFTFSNDLTDEYFVEYKVSGQTYKDTITSGHSERILVSNDTTLVSVSGITNLNSGCKKLYPNQQNFEKIIALPLPELQLDDELTLCSGASTVLSVSGAEEYLWSPVTDLDNPGISNPTFSPSNFGNFKYWVNAIDSNGCKTIDSISISVLSPPPTAEIDRLNSTCNSVCNIVLELSNHSEFGVEWAIQNPNIEGTTYGNNSETFVIDLSNKNQLPDFINFRVTYEDDAGCITNTVEQIDLSTTTVNCPEIVKRECDNRLVLLADLTCFSWGYMDEGTGELFYNISSDIFLTDPELGQNGRLYFVEEADCNNPDCKNVVIFRSEETIPCQIDSDINTFPNPNNGHFTIKLDSRELGNHNLIMFDNLGRIVYSEVFDKTDLFFEKEIHLDRIHPGVYPCKIITEKGKSIDFNVAIID